jgi:hypothetical protein
MAEKINLIIESFTAEEEPETFSEKSPWVTINYGEQEFVTSYGTGAECSFT